MNHSSLTSSSEWFETDGLGGFASGTTTGIRTRRYHALLLTATTPTTGPSVANPGRIGFTDLKMAPVERGRCLALVRRVVHEFLEARRSVTTRPIPSEPGRGQRRLNIDLLRWLKTPADTPVPDRGQALRLHQTRFPFP